MFQIFYQAFVGGHRVAPPRFVQLCFVNQCLNFLSDPNPASGSTSPGSSTSSRRMGMGMGRCGFVGSPPHRCVLWWNRGPPTEHFLWPRGEGPGGGGTGVSSLASPTNNSGVVVAAVVIPMEASTVVVFDSGGGEGGGGM